MTNNCLRAPVKFYLFITDNFTNTGESEQPVKVLPIQWANMAVGISCLSLFGLIAAAHYNPCYAKGITIVFIVSAYQ